MSEAAMMYRKDTDSIIIDVKVHFENGDLKFDGCDMGRRVEELMGDYDYEYWVTVPARAIPKLRRVLWKWFASDRKFLEYLAKRFPGDDCLDSVRAFLSKKGIEHEFKWWV